MQILSAPNLRDSFLKRKLKKENIHFALCILYLVFLKNILK